MELLDTADRSRMNNRSHIHKTATLLGLRELAYKPGLRSAPSGQFNDGCGDGLGRLFPAVRHVVVRSIYALSTTALPHPCGLS